MIPSGAVIFTYIVVIAPAFNQSGIPKEERLDVQQLVSDLRERGKEAFCWGDVPEGHTDWSATDSAAAICRSISVNTQPEDIVAVLSNGGFGGLHQKLLDELN